MENGGELRCFACGATFAMAGLFHGCPTCAQAGEESALEYWVDVPTAESIAFIGASAGVSRHGVWEYRELLPRVTTELTLGEGTTPLTPLPELGKELGINLYVKNETCNPTWSFKDRYVSVALSVAMELGFRRILCLSAGNFGHSAAAYSATAGLECRVVVVPGASSFMQRAMQIHGARVVTMADGEEKEDYVRKLVDEDGWYPLTCMDPATASHIANPYGSTGYKTIAYEVYSQLGFTPDAMFVPVGGGDCLTAIWRGANDLHALGLSTSLPQIMGCQAAAAAPLVAAVESGSSRIQAVPEGETRALSIRHGRCSPSALQAVLDSGGTAVGVTDEEILETIRIVAGYGLLPEAAAATTLAGVTKLARSGRLAAGSTAVCVMTGTAAKWPELVAELADPARAS